MAKKPKLEVPKQTEILLKVDLRRIRWIEPLPRRSGWWSFWGPWLR
jgi:hypothetical protein